MATYHLSFKNGPKGKGRSHASYICRENQYSKHNFEELVYKESGNMPEWAEGNIEFWSSADLCERNNGRSYSEIEIALPNELTPEENIELTKRFVAEVIGEDHPYTFAIHTKKAALDEKQEQPHAHIMFTERKLDGIKRDEELFFKRANSKNPELGGNKKDRTWNSKDKVQDIRKRWEVFHNKELENRNIESRITADSLVTQRKNAELSGDVELAQKLDRQPQIHMGPNVVEIMKVKEEKVLLPRIKDNPEQAEDIRFDYYMNEEENSRIKTYYFIQNINSFVEELKHEVEKIEQQNNINPDYKVSLDSYKEDSTQITIKELQELTNKVLNEAVSCRNELANEYDELKKDVISDKRAQSMAESIYFKREPGEVNKQLKNLDDKLQAQTEKLREFEKRPTPSMLNLSAKKAHNEEWNSLVAEHEKIVAQVDKEKPKLLERKEYFAESMKTPDIQKKIEAIRDGVLEKNVPVKLAAEKKQSEYTVMVENVKDLSRLKNKLRHMDKEQRVELPKRKEHIKEDLTYNAKRVLNDLTEGRNVALRARISDERSY